MRIIIGVDPSESAATACRFVANRAWPLHARITLVGALEPGIDRSRLPWLGQRRGEISERAGMERLLEERAESLRHVGLAVETIVETDETATALIRRAAETFADLVVVGSRGLGPVSRALLGSVSTALVDRAPCPVLVVRADSATRMLLATDGTDSSRNIPRILAAWGNAFRGLPVEVVSVAARHAFVNVWASIDAGETPADDRELLLHEDVARRVADELTDLGWHAAALARCGEPSDEILSAGQEWGADLIVTGSRGLGTLQRLTQGSVAHRVLTHTRSSVLVVRGLVPTKSAQRKPVFATPALG